MSTHTPIADCRCNMTGGRLSCPLHAPAGVGTAMELSRLSLCAQHGHQFAVSPTHAVCNRCERVVPLPAALTNPGEEAKPEPCCDNGLVPRDATPEEVDAGCELGIAFDPCPSCSGSIPKEEAREE